MATQHPYHILLGPCNQCNKYPCNVYCDVERSKRCKTQLKFHTTYLVLKNAICIELRVVLLVYCAGFFCYSNLLLDLFYMTDIIFFLLEKNISLLAYLIPNIMLNGLTRGNKINVFKGQSQNVSFGRKKVQNKADSYNFLSPFMVRFILVDNGSGLISVRGGGSRLSDTRKW